MKPRRKRASRDCGPVLEVSQTKPDQPILNNIETSEVLTSDGVQCEMGSEILRRYWTLPNESSEENDSDQVITGDPIGSDPIIFIAEEEDKNSDAASIKENSTTESGDRANLEPPSKWTNVFPSQGLKIEEGSDEAITTCEGEPGLVLTNNGSGTMVFPLVLNVVNESGSKEVVAVVSLDAMPPTDNSNNLVEHVEIPSKITEDIVVQPDAKPSHLVKRSRTFTCGDCRKIFSNIVPYEKHCFKHHNGFEPFGCPRCSRRFRRRQDLDRHIVCHPEEAFTCTTCFMRFAYREDLLYHCHRFEHGSHSPKPTEDSENTEIVCKVETFRCSQCDKVFSDADLLQHHEFTHTGGELFPCDECGRTFREENDLEMHLKLHKKNQSCDHCDEIFTNVFDFNEHMVAHRFEDSKEDYKCLQCKVKFNSFYFLRKHVTSHGMEVHWCGECGGSGHVGSHGEHGSGHTNSASEKPVLLMVESENLVKQEDDPLKLEDSSSDDITSANFEEQLEVQVHVDEVVVKDEDKCLSEDEVEVSEIVNAKKNTMKGKRKFLGKISKTLPGVRLEPRRKSARNK